MQQYFKQMNQDKRRYQTRSQSLFASKCFRVQMYIMYKFIDPLPPPNGNHHSPMKEEFWIIVLLLFTLAHFWSNSQILVSFCTFGPTMALKELDIVVV